MPTEYSIFQLPSGARCARAVLDGPYGKEEVADLMRQTDPGGPLYGLPLLALAQTMTSVSAEARGMYGRRGDMSLSESWTAGVITNPVIRVIANFLMRVQKRKKVRLFTSEPEAVRWLDERVREDAARAKPAID